MEDGRTKLSEWQLVPFHLGAAIGPMGSNVFTVLFTILLGAFDIDRAVLTLAVPAYLIPYAIVQFASGAVSDLTSRRSSLFIGFGGYGAASLLAALSPNFPIFLVSQILQGTTNAFTTPIVMATLGDVVPRERVGRSMGYFSAVNQAGAMVGPLVAGALGDLNWRLAYLVITAMSWSLAVWYALWFRRYGALVPPRVRGESIGASLRQIVGSLGVQVLLLASIAFLANGAMRGASYLYAEYLSDTWGSGTGQVGIILSMYGLAGLLGGPGAGRLVDRIGPYRGLTSGMVGVALAFLLMAVAPSPLVLAIAHFGVGLAGIIAWSAFNTLVVQAVPESRGTVSSITGSAKFIGQGSAPLWYTPLYGVSPASIFVGAAAMAVLVLAPLARLRTRAADQEHAPVHEPAARGR